MNQRSFDVLRHIGGHIARMPRVGAEPAHRIHPGHG